MGPLIRPLRDIANGLGLAWWAKVETKGPDVTYWFGPFLAQDVLEKELETFLVDLSSEGPGSINHSLLRCRRVEPLTISADGLADG